jgi:endonuclease-3
MISDNQAYQHIILELHDRLRNLYGEKIAKVSDEPVAALVNTILSQNTNDRNRDIAYHRLRTRFPAWEDVRDAPEHLLEETIRPAGLAPTKAPRIQKALQRITEVNGSITLAFLKHMQLDEARAWLTSLDGVGPKTAAIVLLFALGRPAFPVDTHIHRVTKRWGLIPEKTSREKAHVLLENLVPSQLYYEFHLNIIEHGRAVCVARNPRCDQCILQDLCLYYQLRYEGE